jgi:hypothetical protein|tara:strand:+ start:746 stop:952 length:207 start_codon:yes stop_codon:yes gene_type:complete
MNVQHNISDFLIIYRKLVLSAKAAVTGQTKQTEQDKQDRLFELAGDVLGAISVFFIFYAAIVLAGIFQ